MKRKWAIAAASLSLLLPLTGCWSRHELNSLAIVVGMGFDKAADGVEVSVQIVNPGKVSSSGQSQDNPPVSTFTQTGRTIPEALSRMTTVLSKQMYLSHLRIVIFGEQLARQGIRNCLDYLTRDRAMRNDFFLIIAKGGKASDMLTVSSMPDPIPANNMYEKLSNSDRLWAATGKITLDKLALDLMSKGKSPALTGLRLTGSDTSSDQAPAKRAIVPPAIPEYQGMAVFKGERMVGWLNENETKTLNYIQNSVNYTVWTVNCPDGGRVALNLTSVDTKVKMKISGDIPVAYVRSRVELRISSVASSVDTSKAETIDWLRMKAANLYTDLIQSSVESVQRKYGTDVFGFGVYVHRQLPKLWREIPDWDQAFVRLRVRVYPEIYIRQMGTIEKPINVS